MSSFVPMMNPPSSNWFRASSMSLCKGRGATAALIAASIDSPGIGIPAIATNAFKTNRLICDT